MSVAAFRAGTTRAIRDHRHRVSTGSTAGRSSQSRSEEFFDYEHATIGNRRRASRSVEWPITSSARWSRRVGPDLITLLGSEPQLRWRTFCDEIISVARQTNARMVITLGALLAEVPHTRPTAVFGTSYDSSVAQELGLQPSTYEGPTGIVGVLHNACVIAGIPSVSLWAAVPSYVPGANSPKAALALVERITDMLASVYPRSISRSPPLPTTPSHRARGQDDETVTYVEQLEERFDESQGVSPAGSLVEEVEQYLSSARTGLVAATRQAASCVVSHLVSDLAGWRSGIVSLKISWSSAG